jgi:hypothetical protein
MQDLPYSLMAELEKMSADDLPPVHLWQPDAEKDIDLVITRNGVWNYLGSPIKRPRLIRLFASVLRRDGDEYCLVTPVERCLITVEDVPFQVLLMDVLGQGDQMSLTMTTDMGEQITVDANHPLRITQNGDEWIPYVMVRGGMEARISRNVYYQLADLLIEATAQESGEPALGVYSGGEFFPFMPA